MSIILTDQEIQNLLEEPKRLPADYHQKLVPKPKRGHDECQLDIVGDAGNSFCVLIRRSQLSPLDFSIILRFDPKGSSQTLRLKRYNGKSHEHANKLEKQGPFYDFHIHTATERYQKAGLREDWYAEVTNRFGDWRTALDCLLAECGFVIPTNDAPLLEERPGES